MRIAGGRWAGADLASPGGRVRPTTEEVRAAWLERLDNRLHDARVLDLFAGTGALGLEALSRGAATCDFVESGQAALHALKANVAAFRLRSRTRIFRRDALDFATHAARGAYDLAFADPPYGSRQLDRLVDIWLEKPFSTILSVEHAADHVLPGRSEQLRFGDTTVSFFGMG